MTFPSDHSSEEYGLSVFKVLVVVSSVFSENNPSCVTFKG